MLYSSILFSDNGQTKWVEIFHKNEEHDCSLIITENAIIFNGITWANRIFASITQLGIVNLRVKFADGTSTTEALTYAADSLVNAFVHLIVRNCWVSIQNLELWYSEKRYLDSMISVANGFHQSGGHLFPNLKTLRLEHPSVLDSEILYMLRHTTKLKIYHPKEMNLWVHGQEKTKKNQDIQFGSLVSFVLHVATMGEPQNTMRGTQVLPINSPNIRSMQIYDVHRDNHGPNDFSVSIKWLKSMKLLRKLIVRVNGDPLNVNLSNLKHFPSITRLIIPMKNSILPISKVEAVRNLICLWCPEKVIFLLNHLPPKKMTEFASQHYEPIVCKMRGAYSNAYSVEYNVKFVSGSGDFTQLVIEQRSSDENEHSSDLSLQLSNPNNI